MRIEALSTVVAALESGKRPKGGASGDSGSVPSLGGEHLNNDGGFRFDNLKYIEEQFFVDLKKGAIKANDILIVKDGATTGKVSYVGSDFPFERAAINEHLFALTVDTTVANPRYVFGFLKSPQGQKEILKDFRGAAIGGISRGFVDLAKIPLPPLNDQIRIAHLLGKVEGLIAQRKQHLQQLDDLLKSVFLEMFGNPVRNEKGWDVDRIGRSIKVQGGFAFKSMDISSTGAIKLVKIANVHFENLTWDDVSYVPDSFIDVYKKFALKEGDLLVALTRPVIKSINVVKTATVRNEDLPCLLNQRVARFLINPNQINKRFFLQYCYTEFFRNTVEGLCPPGLQPNVSTNQIENIPIFYPPIYLQEEFAVIAEKVEALKTRYQQSLTDLEALYGALSQQAFKGELDLSRVPLPKDESHENDQSLNMQKNRLGVR